MSNSGIVSNVVVLLDQFTRNATESVMYDTLVKHTTVITDIREITDNNRGCNLVIFEPAVPCVVARDTLQFVTEEYDVTVYLIYQLEAVADSLYPLVQAVKANYKRLEWNLIYAVVNKDSAILEPYETSSQVIKEFTNLVSGLSVEAAGPVNQLYLSYLTLAASYRNLLTINSELEETLANYKSVSTRMTTAMKELRVLFDSVVSDNRTYCAMLSESYDTMFSGIYPDRPRVLYIKTVSHLSGVDNLIMVLYSVLTKQYKASCKVVKLVDSANASSLRYVPNIYFPLTDSYSTADVLTNDFLMSLGAYNLLMGLLMLNRSRLDYLIIHDMRGIINHAIDAALYDLCLHEVSQDYAILGEYDNILSDCKQATYYWNFGEVSEYTGTNVMKIAHHKTVSAILDSIM